MAAIGEIRKHYGILIIIIGIALLAFIMGDLFKGSPQQVANIGEVAGEEISYKDFSMEVEKAIEAEKTNRGKMQLTAAETYQVKQATWNKMVRKVVMDKEYEELGLAMPADRLFELVQGKKPHRYILQYFTDPATGEYKSELVLNYLQNLDNMPRTNQLQWIDFENAIKEDQLNTDFTNLISKAYYVPSAFAKMQQERDTKQVKAQVLAQLYSSVPDADVEVQEQDFANYYNEHKEDFKQEASRTIDYVSFDVRPSAEDKKEQRHQFDGYVNELSTLAIDKLPTYVNTNSDAKYQDKWYKKTELPLQIAEAMFSSEVGHTVAAYESMGAYNAARLMEKTTRPDSLKASHILIAYAGASRASQDISRTKEQAQTMADSLLAIVKKNPKTIEDLAVKHSDDGAVAQNKGHYDWFPDGQMVPEFNEAIVENDKNDVVLVETVFGYHVIRIDGKKDLNERVKVAMLKRNITPSNQTFQEVYVKANEFANKCKTAEFSKVAEEMNLTTRVFENVSAMQENLPGQKDARQIIIWAFNEERNIGDLNLFDIGNGYLVTNLGKINKKGYASLNDVKARITQAVKNTKKAEYLMQKINTSVNKTNFEALAQEIPNAVVDTLDFSYASNNVPGVGPEPEVVAAVMNMEKGQVSAPIKGSRAMFVLKTDEVKTNKVTKDEASIAKEMNARFVSGINYYLFKALEKQADIEDNRHTFY